MTFNKVHIWYFSFKLLIRDNEDSFYYPCWETINISDYHALRRLYLCSMKKNFPHGNMIVITHFTFPMWYNCFAKLKWLVRKIRAEFVKNFVQNIASFLIRWNEREKYLKNKGFSFYTVTSTISFNKNVGWRLNIVCIAFADSWRFIQTRSFGFSLNDRCER